MQGRHYGNILEINLTNRETNQTALTPDVAERFAGGAGLNAHLLYQKTTPGTGPLDPENPLIFGAGPLVGSGIPTGARSTLTGLSPLTGIMGDSNCGGLWGVMLRRTGNDYLIITGALDEPGVLVVGPGGVDIEAAADLWGRDTLSTEKALKAKYPGSIVATIGPAGEKLVKYACVMTNRNANSFSQAGLGAVFGAKKLKAIVLKGNRKIPIADPAGVKAVTEKMNQWCDTFPFTKLFKRYGTAMFINGVAAQGLLYAENWRRRFPYNELADLDLGAYYQATKSRDHSCFRCPLGCGKHWEIKSGPYKNEKGYGYEIAYIIALGLSLGIRNVPDILHLVKEMNLMGLDVKEFSGCVGMAIDARKQNILTRDQCDGIPLDWGNTDAFDALIQKTAHREGIGDILAEGTKDAAARIGGGAEDYALHMKGMHWPGNSAPPFVLAFSMSTRGGDFLKGMPHLIAQPNNPQIAKKLFDATPETFKVQSHADKGRAVWWHENYKLLNDCVGTCYYLSMVLLADGAWLPAHIAEAYNAATGSNLTGGDLFRAAERGYQVERAVNALRGIDRRHDDIKKRPEKDSWADGIDLNKRGMLDEYYQYRGASADGLPLPERLAETGLDSIADDLGKSGVLGKRGDSEPYLSLDDIVHDPSDKEIKKNLKVFIQNKVKRRIMGNLAKDPLKLRKHWEKRAKKLAPKK